MKTSKLKFNPNNPRKIAPAQIEKLMRSIKNFPEMMVVRPIVYDPDTMQVLGGNQRLSAIKALGMKDIPDEWAVAAEFTDEQKREFMVKDNALMGEWDFDLLEAGWGDLDLKDWGIELPEMFQAPKESDKDIDGLDEVPSDAAVKLGKKWGTKIGQIWQAGSHRLLCGDATDKSLLDALIGSTEPDICFSDPPYGIDVVGDDGKIGKNSRTYKKVHGDANPFDPSWMLDRFSRLILWGANYFSNILPRGQWIVWDKDVAEELSFSMCELAWASGKGVRVSMYRCTWSGFRREGESNKQQRYHPTQKPVKLTVDILNDYAKDGDIVMSWCRDRPRLCSSSIATIFRRHRHPAGAYQ